MHDPGARQHRRPPRLRAAFAFLFLFGASAGLRKMKISREHLLVLCFFAGAVILTVAWVALVAWGAYTFVMSW
jgi:hypothetical protein